MDILCPTCQKKLTIPDQYAGQKIKCPSCAGMFNAPALPGGADIPAFIPPPAPPAPEPFKLAPEPTPAPVVEVPMMAETVQPFENDAPIPPPPPPGDYGKGLVFRANPNIVPWIAPVGMTLIFFLSFFPMIFSPFGGPNIWQLGFNVSMGWFLAYCLLALIFGWPLSIVSFLIGRGIIPLPPAVGWIRTWHPVILLGLLGLPFLTLFFHWLYMLFAAPITTVPYKLIVRLHGLVLIGLILEFWLERRKPRNLPEPKIEIRW